MKQVVLLMMSLIFIVSMPLVGAAEVNVNINVPPPPPPPAPPVQEGPPPPGPYQQYPEPGEQAEAPPPPPLQFAAPPEIVVVPSGQTYVYMIPNMFGVYFFGGFWYRYYNGYWFRAVVYDAPWVPIAVTVIPRFIIGVPPEYPYFLPPRYHRIHYHEFYGHWRDWDRGRHWHNYDWYRHEMRADVVRGRLHHIERERVRWRRGEGDRPHGFVVHTQSKPGVHHPPPSDVRRAPSDIRKGPPSDVRKAPPDVRKGPPSDVRRAPPDVRKGPPSDVREAPPGVRKGPPPDDRKPLEMPK